MHALSTLVAPLSEVSRKYTNATSEFCQRPENNGWKVRHILFLVVKSDITVNFWKSKNVVQRKYA